MLNENENKQNLQMFCPLIWDMVKVSLVCEKCPYWIMEKCFYPVPKKTRKILKPRYSTRRPRLRKGGRGVKVPPVWERWSKLENPDALNIPDEPEYGVAGLLGEDENSSSEPGGKREAIDLLIKKYLPMAEKLVKKWGLIIESGREEEAVQEALEAIKEAAERYEGGREIKFSTYFYKTFNNIYSEISEEIIKGQRKGSSLEDEKPLKEVPTLGELEQPEILPIELEEVNPGISESQPSLEPEPTFEPEPTELHFDPFPEFPSAELQLELFPTPSINNLEEPGPLEKKPEALGLEGLPGLPGPGEEPGL